MKNSNGYAKGIKIIIYILDVFFICFIGYRVYDTFLKNGNNNNNNNNNGNVEETIKKNVDQGTIEELITYIPFAVSTFGDYRDAYNGTTITTKDVSSAILSSIVTARYNESYTAKNGNSEDIVALLKENNIDRGIVFLNDDINKFLMKRYNIDLNSIDNSSDDIKLITLNNKYSVFVISATNSSQIYNIPIYYRAYEEDDNIIMFEKVVFVVLKGDKYYVYKNTDFNTNQDPIKTYEYTDDSGKSLGIDAIVQKIQDDLINYTSQFKHTFKKNDTGYYWYSTEFVE